MKAMVLKENLDMSIMDIPCDALGENECRIRVKNIGVCSSDIYRGCDNGAYFYPLIMGHEFSGEVLEIGANVTNIKIGDRVAVFPLLPCFSCDACDKEMYLQCSNYNYYGSRCNGAFAEYINVNAWNLLPLLQGISYQDAAAVEPLAVVLHALRRVGLMHKLQVNEASFVPLTIAIIGSGFLGLLMAQILHIYYPASRITVIDRNQFKLDIAKNYATEVVLADSFNFVDVVQKNFGSSKFQLVIEATGSPHLFAHSLELAGHGGTVLWLGNISNDLHLQRSLVSSILRKELKVLGTWNSIYRPGKSDDWSDALQLISKGLKPSALVTHWLRLEELPFILAQMYHHKNNLTDFQLIKAMVEI